MPAYSLVNVRRKTVPVTDHKRRRAELDNLLDEHHARVSMLEPLVEAHSLMPRDVIQRAEQQNLRRAIGLRESCARYAKEVQLAVDRHIREQDEERGAAVHQEVSPPAEPAPDAEQSEEE